jgi:2-oxoglutarate dehydrogenase E2 component (dihydrolipoamide succinyltransferase)
VIKGAERLSMAGVEKAIGHFAIKVKEGKLTADELTGGGFTITNGGVYGSLLSTPILPPQQCAILGMHKIAKRPVVIDDAIVIRQMMYLALSYDHRIIDGKEAVSFLVEIKNLLEDPARMLLDI